MDNKRRFYFLIFFINSLITICYLRWRISSTLLIQNGGVDAVASAAYLLYEFISIIYLWAQIDVISRKKSAVDSCKTDTAQGDTLQYPEVDIYVLNKKDNQKEAYNTINACLLMDYPDKNKIHIIPVNGDMEQLNEVLKKSDSPLVAVMEAGRLPRHEFLTETVACFLNKNGMEKIGFVQTAVGYFNADAYQFRLFSQQLVPNEKQYFYRCLQPAFDKDNSVVCCGSGTVFSREALEEAGGFDTSGAEGYVATGIKLLKRGYHCRYIDKNLVSGFFESDIATCIMRHKLRVTDAIDAVKKEHILFSLGLSFRQRKNIITYASSLASPFRCLISILIPVLYGLFGIKVIKADAVLLGIFWLLIYIGSDICLQGFSGKCISLKWQQIYQRSVTPYLLLPCIKALFGKYRPEDIGGIKSNKLKNTKYFVPHIILLALSLAAFLMCINNLIIQGELLNITFGIWLLVNIYFELMAVFWIIGRPYDRQEDRVEAHISYELTDSIQTIRGMTRDLSSRGISVWCKRPYDIDDSEIISVKLNNGRYQANMEGSVIGVERDKGYWKYIILFQNMETFKQQYYGILYDREPVEVAKLSRPQNVFSDLKRNIGSRFSHNRMEYRTMVRVPVNRNIKVAGGGSIFVKNFNYKYLIVRKDSQPQEFVTIMPVNGLELSCERMHRFGDNIYQYRVKNYEELRNNSETREQLCRWLEVCMAEYEAGK